MGKINLSRFGKIRLSNPQPLQKFVHDWVLRPNFDWITKPQIIWENIPKIPATPVIIAMNHTDRWGYCPFFHRWRKEYGRYTLGWMKGKYYEVPVGGWFMEKVGAIPAVSRGFIISKDFRNVAGVPPAPAQYRALRDWVEAVGFKRASGPPAADFPPALLTRPREMMGRFFDPQKESWPEAVNALFSMMMREFMRLHERSFDLGFDLLIYPEGTRSKKLLRGKPGIGQLALYFKKYTILPVACNGTDRLYPGASLWAKKGAVTYRFGEPISPEEMKPFWIEEDFIPFTPEAEEKFMDRFQGVADMVMRRIAAGLDPEYLPDPAHAEVESEASLFI